MSNREKWLAILDEISKWQEPLTEWGYPVRFRGQRNSHWGVKSSLHRYIEENFKILGLDDERHKIELLRSVYQTLYRKFKAKAWRFLESSERSPWGIVFAMQHFGLPTNLLDWTESFACALYFAQQDREPECDAALYLLNPERLNKISSEVIRDLYAKKGLDGKVYLGEVQIPLEESFSEDNFSSYYHPGHKQFQQIAADICRTIAVAPLFSNPRMLAQRAAFTLCGLSFSPLEEQFDNRIIKKVILPSDTYDDAQEFLKLVGMSHFGYFPDITNLVRDMKDEMQREIEALASAIEKLPSTRA